jgi:tRNA(fMet)-specific endonuclease VapC
MTLGLLRTWISEMAEFRYQHRRYAEIRLHLEQRGRTIGFNDLLIAAHALALDLTLVIANVEEFARVLGLRLENWLAS